MNNQKFLGLFLCATAFLIVGCKKNYTCLCTTVTTVPGYEYNGQVYQPSVNTDYVSEGIKNTLKSAEAECAFKEHYYSYESPNAAQGQTSTTVVRTCELNGF
jgi:apolipoprotein N-acyltransferase